MLDGLEGSERSLGPVVRVLHIVVILMVFAFLSIGLLHDDRPASRGGLILLVGFLIVAGVSAKPITTRRYLQMLREARRTRRFWWRLIGFILVVVGNFLILRAESATFLEEMLAAVVMGYVLFYHVLQV